MRRPAKKAYRYGKPENGDAHYRHFTALWIVFGLTLLALLIVWIVVLTQTATTTTVRFSSNAANVKTRVQPTDCHAGEEFYSQSLAESIASARARNKANADARAGIRSNVKPKRQLRAIDVNDGVCRLKQRYPLAAETEILDQRVSPCDSFYRYACGKWLEQHSTEPEDRAFTAAHLENQRALKPIIASTAFYKSCVDTLVNEKHSKETIMEARHVRSRFLEDFLSLADIPSLFGRLTKDGYTIPFVLTIEKDPTGPTMIPFIRYDSHYHNVPGGLHQLLPEITAIFAWGGFNADEVAEHKANVYIGMQTEMDKHWTREEEHITDFISYLRDGFSRHIVPMKSLYALWNWEAYLEHIDGTHFDFDPEQRVWCLDQSYLLWLLTDGLPKKFTLSQWQTYVEFTLMYHSHNFMPQLPDDVYFKKHDRASIGPHIIPGGGHVLKRTTISSVSGAPTKWTAATCARATQMLMPGLVSQQFIEQRWPGKMEVEVRRNVTEMVEMLRGNYVELIRQTSWIDLDTKARLVKKISGIIIRVMHPNAWRTEPFLDRLFEDRYLRNLNFIRAHRVRQNLVLWSEQFNRDAISRFGAPLSTVNAFYSPLTNTISVFAGIMQYPFYSEHFDATTRLATLGTVVAHEMMHALDNFGKEFDHDGTFNPQLWSPASLTAFNERSDCIVREYNDPSIMRCRENATTTYGAQTLGENIADINGLRLVYSSLADLPQDTLKTAWTSTAQLWCESYSSSSLCERVTGDVHAINAFRVDKAFYNLPDFHRAFGCIPRRGADQIMCSMYGV